MKKISAEEFDRKFDFKSNESKIQRFSNKTWENNEENT